MSTTYVKFIDLSNNSLLVGGGTNGWTPVDSSTFDQTLAAGLAGAMTPPTFSLPLADSGVAAQLEAAAATGRLFQTEVASYDDSGRLTSDYVLTLGAVSADQVSQPEDGNLVHTLTLTPGGYTSKTTTYDASGKPTTTTGGYSYISKKPINTPAPSAPPEPSSLQANADVDAHSYSPAATYFVLGKAGGNYIHSSDQAVLGKQYLPASGHNTSEYNGNLFEAEGYISSLNFPKGGTNTISFSYVAPVDASSPVLFDMLATKSPLKNVEFIQSGSLGKFDQAQIVSDTLYNNVIITGETYQLGDGGADARIMQFQAGNGTYVTSHENTSSEPTAYAVSVTAPTTVTAGVQATSTRLGSAEIDYQMAIGTGAGATTATISSALFSVKRNDADTTYSPLTVTFDSAPSAATLAALALPVQNLSIDQTKASGTSSSGFVFDTLTFRTNGTATLTTTANGDGTFSYTYTFNVLAFKEAYQDPPQTTNGQVNTSLQWSQIRNPDGSTSLQADPDAPCFVTGTLIRTVRGGGEQDIAVEHLVVGDVVVTASGERRPVRWIGHRDTDCRARHEACPVRIAAHAFGESLPARDLHLSPGHPVLVDADADGLGGHLVPIMCLINGTSVRRIAIDDVTYWHVELDAHDVLLAEGLPAESYIDLGSRAWFAGADGALHDPDFVLPRMPGRCRPVALDGPVVEAERRRLDAVFSMRLAAACAWPAEGSLSFL